MRAAVGADAAVNLKILPRRGLARDSTTPEVVEFVLALQLEIDRLRSAVHQLPDEWRGEVESLRSELSAQTEMAIRRLAEAEIRMRLIGVVSVVVGIALSYVGNST